MWIHAAPATKHRLSTSDSVSATQSRGCRVTLRVTAEANFTPRDRVVRQYRAGPRDDPIEAVRRFGDTAGERLSRRDVGRRRRVGGEQRCDPIAFVDLETPVGKGGEVEKPCSFILGCVSPA